MITRACTCPSHDELLDAMREEKDPIFLRMVLNAHGLAHIQMAVAA